MQGNPELSIIIVNYNVRQLLLNCIQSIIDTSANVNYEIIVVDNASNDGSIEAVKGAFPQLQVIANKENVGFASANNQGFELAVGDFILMLNPDTIVKDDTIVKCLEYCKRNPLTIVGSRLFNADGTVQSLGYSFPTVSNITLSWLFRWNRLPTIRQSFVETDWVLGAFMLFHKDAFKELVGFDEGFFMYGEEKDFCYRAKKKGYKVIVYGDGNIVHLGCASTKLIEARAYVWFLRSQKYFFEKHYSNFKARLLWLILLIGVLERLILWQFLSMVFGYSKAKGRTTLYKEALRVFRSTEKRSTP